MLNTPHRLGCPTIDKHKGINALAVTNNRIYKTELLHRQGRWRNMQDLEMVTFGWVDWFNYRQLLEHLGNIPPTEAEENF